MNSVNIDGIIKRDANRNILPKKQNQWDAFCREGIWPFFLFITWARPFSKDWEYATSQNVASEKGHLMIH